MAELIEIAFYGVVAMKLATAYRSLTIDVAGPGQVEEMAKLAALNESQSSRVKVLALKSTGDDGLVACLSYSAWSLPKRGSYDSAGLPEAESILIFKG